MNMINLNALRDKAYKTACEHGLHDKELSNEHCLCLVISELMEAVEADRKGKRILKDKEEVYTLPQRCGFRMEMYDKYIKGSVSEELADAAIRLLDLAGLRGVDIEVYNEGIEDNASSCRDETFTETIYQIATMYERQRITYDWRLDKMLNNMLSAIFGLAKHLEIDLLWHIKQKMKYNKLGDKMYGKKY